MLPTRRCWVPSTRCRVPRTLTLCMNENIKMRTYALCLLLCTAAPLSYGSDFDSLRGYLTTPITHIRMGTDLPVTMNIENQGESTVYLDCSPDEVIHTSKEYGPAHRERGSRWVATISQQTRYLGFITFVGKMGSPDEPQIALPPKSRYGQKINFPTDSEVYLQSGPLIPGEATITATAHLVIGTNSYSMKCSTNIFLEPKEKENAQQGVAPYAAQGASSGER